MTQIPVLKPTDFCHKAYHDVYLHGKKHCMEGWLQHLFSGRDFVKKNEQWNQYEEAYTKLAKFLNVKYRHLSGTYSIVTWNDSHTFEELAAAWNECFFGTKTP